MQGTNGYSELSVYVLALSRACVVAYRLPQYLFLSPPGASNPPNIYVNVYSIFCLPLGFSPQLCYLEGQPRPLYQKKVKKNVILMELRL